MAETPQSSNDTAGDKPVRAWTPDPNSYHQLDGRQDDLLPHGITGGTMIPRANHDGGSRGFDCQQAGIVCVDPHMQDGGFSVDLRLLDENTIKANLNVDDASDTFRKLSSSLNAGAVDSGNVKPNDRISPAIRSNPVMPARYVVPKSSSDGTQTSAAFNEEVAAVNNPFESTKKKASDVSQGSGGGSAGGPKPVSHPVPDGGGYNKPEVHPNMDPNQLMNLLQMVVSQAMGANSISSPPQQPEIPQPATPPQSVPPAADSTPPAPVQHAAPASPPTAEPQSEAFDVVASLQLPFITNGKPQRPGYDVLFDLGGLGQTSAKFHSVIEASRCVILVYDTRYEDGQQYVPPDRGSNVLTIHIPNLKTKFRVFSMGINFAVGCLDVIVLIKDDEQEAADADTR